MKAYEKLLEPITIGTHQWRNRMVKAPSSAMSWDPGQFCNERIIGLYDAISKGGASAIILGGMICDDPATLIDDATAACTPWKPTRWAVCTMTSSFPAFLNWLTPCTGTDASSSLRYSRTVPLSRPRAGPGALLR